MNTVEIIMQQKRIAAEKKEAERKLAYDAIKEWAERNADKFAHELLNNVANQFGGSATMARYRCVSGFADYRPLGHSYPECVGQGWKVEYWEPYGKDGLVKKNEFGFGFVKRFFEQSPIENNDYTKSVCSAFVSQLVFHTALPKLFESEGFVVKHNGCGCCEEIEVRLPEE